MQRNMRPVFVTVFVTIFAFLLTSTASPTSVFAESADCSGKISGTTVSGNINGGRTYFDAHEGSGVSGAASLAPLGIVGIKVNKGSAISANDAKASFYLYYDVAATSTGGACGYDAKNKFDFHFLKDFKGDHNLRHISN